MYFLIKALENPYTKPIILEKKTKNNIYIYIPDTHVCIFIDFYDTNIPTVYPCACVHSCVSFASTRESLSMNQTAASGPLNHPIRRPAKQARSSGSGQVGAWDSC